MLNSFKVSILIAALAIVVSTTLLYLITWDYGVKLTTDSLRYIHKGVNFSQDNGLFLERYFIKEDRLILDPMTRHPPLLSIGYALLLGIGIPLPVVPQFFSLIFWGVLLVGVWVLTYKLSHSYLVASFTVIIISIAEPFLLIYTNAMSEVLFLPLLVWSLVPLIDFHNQETNRLLRFSIASFLLALLLLTRYSGIVLFAAIGLWWMWGRIYRQQLPFLFQEFRILVLASIPVLWWKFHAPTFSGHYTIHTNTFLDGVIAIVQQIAYIFLPSVRSDYTSTTMHFLHVPLLILVFLLLWRFRPQKQSLLVPHRSPILLMVLAYLALYTIIQPFFSFLPMDYRDATTLLIVFLPWLMSTMATTFSKNITVWVLFGYGAVNIVLFLGTVQLSIPEAFSFLPPSVHDLAGKPEQRKALLEKGSPRWLISVAEYEDMQPQFTTRAIENHHKELVVLLQKYDNVVVVSDLRSGIFATKVSDFPLLPTRLDSDTLKRWLEYGTCSPTHATLAVVLLDWDVIHPSVRRSQIEEKCPGSAPYTLQHGVVYIYEQIPTD
jgi:hypothetical protein